MSYGYGGKPNPFDQRDSPSSGGYNAPSAPYPSGGRAQYNMPAGGQQYGQQYNSGYNSQSNMRQDNYNSQANMGRDNYGSQPAMGRDNYNSQPAMGRDNYNAPPAIGRDNYGAQPAMGRDNYGQNVEMAPLAQNGGAFGGRQADGNAILNECREIDKGIDSIQSNLDQLRSLQQRSLDDPDSSLQSSTNQQLDALSAQTMTLYRSFAARIKAIKQQPESGSPKNAPQVGKVDRKLKTAINQYQNVESDFRKKLQNQMARQYRIVRPDASNEEVQAAVEDTSNQQVFSQALLQSDRRGQSRAALAAVQDRHVAIQKIEGQMIELAQLFQDMEALVVQQEAAVTVIEQKGEEVVENMDQGNQQITTAIKSARARNKKKWWCLLICVIIIAIIVIVIVIYVVVIKGGNKNNNNNNNTNNAKRHLLEEALAVHARNVLPGVAWTGDETAAGQRSVAGRLLLPN